MTSLFMIKPKPGRGQTFSLGDEVKIKVAGVNLEDRKIDFELLQQMTHAGRVIRSRARCQNHRRR